MEKKKIEFYGGMAGLIAPFIVLVLGILWLSVRGEAMPMAFWVPCLAGIAVALILSKDKTLCAETIIKGASNEMVAVMLMAWFLAGIVAELMEQTGLIGGLVWLATSIGLPGALFPLITFLTGSLLSTATGTALGTVMTLAPILYPVGVALGANPPVMCAAIVSAAYFGDNIAPVSDTTIASAYSQGVDVSAVVKSRLKYAFAAAAIASVLFVIVGGSWSATDVDLSFIGDVSPKGLIMLAVPALMIFLMVTGKHLIVALFTSGIFGIILGAVTGLLDIKTLLVVDMNSFSVGGIIVNGINSLVDIAIFAFFLMGLIKLLEEGGFFEFLINKLENFTKTPKTAELTIAIVDILLCALTVANSVVIVMEGPIAKDILVEKHKITEDRSANILDAVSCVAMCLIPYGFAPMLAVMFAASSGAPVDFSVNQVVLYSFHGWALGVVMFASILTGWGRTFKKE